MYHIQSMALVARARLLWVTCPSSLSSWGNIDDTQTPNGQHYGFNGGLILCRSECGQSGGHGRARLGGYSHLVAWHGRRIRQVIYGYLTGSGLAARVDLGDLKTVDGFDMGSTKQELDALRNMCRAGGYSYTTVVGPKPEPPSFVWFSLSNFGQFDSLKLAGAERFSTRRQQMPMLR